MMPIAMMLGFSGPRKWSVASDADDTIERTVDHEVEAWLIRRLSLLSRELDLEPGFFFCGVSQIAIRGDMAFTRACRTLKIPQRILLTQHRDAYFGSGEPEGPPDFTDDEKVEALALLESPHIIEDRMASRAPDRLTRFEETNVELVRQSDLLICLILRNSETRRGGTQDVIAKAKKSGKPVLCVTIEVLAGGVDFQEEWLGDPFLPGEQIKVASHAHCGLFDPEIPDIHAPDGFPCSDRCLQTMMEHSEREARKHSRFFKSAAFIIVGTHCLATVLATAALKVHSEIFLVNFLGIEIVLLLTGYFVHHHLHHRAAATRWALHRLVAEITRSVLSLKDCHLSLEYLHSLPFPAIVHPYIRTMELLHLRATRLSGSGGWQRFRNAYLADRLEGQLVFYRRQGKRAERLLNYAQRFFVWSSRLAILCTAMKIVFVLSHLSFAGLDSADWKALLGFFAVILPVVAVGALSLAAANDLEARNHSFNEMLRFLGVQKDYLISASSERESSRLVIETEARLIGETANWFSRRSFTGVA